MRIRDGHGAATARTHAPPSPTIPTAGTPEPCGPADFRICSAAAAPEALSTSAALGRKSRKRDASLFCVLQTATCYQTRALEAPVSPQEGSAAGEESRKVSGSLAGGQLMSDQLSRHRRRGPSPSGRTVCSASRRAQHAAWTHSVTTRRSLLPLRCADSSLVRSISTWMRLISAWRQPTVASFASKLRITFVPWDSFNTLYRPF